MITVGLIIGPAVLLLLIALLLRQRIVIRRQRKKRKEEEEKERAEFNPVYATYEIHDDPVAEVKQISI